MEDKLDNIYELMTKMYVDLTDKMDSMGNEIKEISRMQKKMDMKIEQKIEPELQSLYEAKDIIFDNLERIETSVGTIAARLDSQELEIKVLRGVK